MAFIIASKSNKGSVHRIAANQTDLDSLGLVQSHYSIETISDADFNNLKNNTKTIASHDGTNYVYNDTTADFTADMYADAFRISKEALKRAIEKEPSHADAAGWQTYLNYLESFDLSTITFPINKPWEKYCEDNSVTYYNVLQLP